MSTTLTSLFEAAEREDKSVSDDLFAALYTELHRLARSQLAHQAPMSIGATTVLCQAYIEIAGRSLLAFSDRLYFMSFAARLMGGLSIDHAGTRSAQKRGSQSEIASTKSHLERTVQRHWE